MKEASLQNLNLVDVNRMNPKKKSDLQRDKSDIVFHLITIFSAASNSASLKKSMFVSVTPLSFEYFMACQYKQSML